MRNQAERIVAVEAKHRVLFFCSVSSAIGIGHLKRCLALADALHTVHRVHCEFLLSVSEAQLWALALIPPVFGVQSWALATDDERGAAALATYFRESARDILVLDIYALTTPFLATLCDAGVPVVVIDDFAGVQSYPCAAIVNHHLHAPRLAYAAPSDTRCLFGPHYALVGVGFLQHRRRPDKAEPDVATRLLVTMGGADPNGATARILAALRRMAASVRRRLHVQVILGPGYRGQNVLQNAVFARCDVIRHAPQMAKLMGQADVVISAGGGTLLELACVGTPSLVLAITRGQEMIGADWEAQGGMRYLGAWDAVDDFSIASSTEEVLMNRDERLRLRERAQWLVDGRGAMRVADFIWQEMMKGDE
ncbi:UDP-2,4-diacetamido-2,4,6-trideoxy-beta-L-altropyranose hydrolase [Alicyclobacillus fodiniaquatilis]|uniref:UDP-2,4-diacetamido-2,4, 6-trideoxy-beta-L-altropyranose hydrolase n=1 Tax=Alicyclobacillus fodiniaquatilis TaxID=1661150 RepID=A0ABW4JEM4_9BACL